MSVFDMITGTKSLFEMAALVESEMNFFDFNR